MEERIGHYRIVSELGRGGMGVVYKAHEESLNRFVALKVLGDHLAEDLDYVERFQREARSAAALTHPNIVQVYRVDEDNGRHYFAMEYVSGTSIQRMIKTQGKLDPVAATHLILQASSGLGAAHEHGVIHRDIKPANLMVDDRGLVKIADFGLALLAGAATRLTATGMFMGTPGYLSPEQCLDEEPDQRTDIYSLGVTFYEMLTGKIPFTADSPLALLRCIMEVEPKDVRELNPNVPEEIRAILRKMMAKNRSDRYANCGELITDLQAFLESAGGEKSSVSPVVAAAVAATAATGEKNVIVHEVGEPTVIASEMDAVTVISGATPEELNTNPTVAVDSAELASDGLQPPPPPPSSVESPPPPLQTEPEIIAEPAESLETVQSRRDPKIGLAIAAAVVLMLISAGLFAAWRLGAWNAVMDLVAGKSTEETTEVAELLLDEPSGETPAENVAADPEVESLDSSPSVVSEPEIAGTTDHESGSMPSAQSQSADQPSAVAGKSHAREDTSEPGRSAAATTTHTGRSVPVPSSTQKSVSRTSQVREPAPLPAQVGHGVALILLGEPLLANAAADYVRENLDRRGLEVFDGSGLPGVMDIIENGPEEDGSTLAKLVRPHARWVVVVRADSMGERELFYQGRYDIEYQARLHVVGHDLKSLRPVGRGIHVPIGYTHLSVERKVEELLRPRLKPLAGKIAEIGN
ncbi:MAG: protein kinase [Thermoanaerobaculales bacterium]|nr:protein kinase [Thermoanaerobaculales bacterium]